MDSAVLMIDRSAATQKRAVTVSLKHRAEIMATVAAESADAVDRDARFPAEAFSAAREQRLLGMQVPAELGGEEASVSDVVDVCYILGRACASTAMIFAMHQIMVAILVRHARNSPWHKRLLRRLVADQLLLASSTTDGSGGGDLRKSTAFVEQVGTRISFAKDATVVSYGAQGDAILATARRSADAPPSDQVLVALLRDDYELERSVEWDTLGMRGTCSAGFKLKGGGDVEQVLPEPYQRIHTHTMMPVANLTWSGVWAGLAAGSVDRARRFIRGAARHGNGQPAPGAAHLTRATMSLRALRAIVASALQRFEAAGTRAEEIEALDFQTTMTLLKVNSSEMAIATVMSSMQACGLSGYRNTGEFSVSRHLRDVLSSSIMINNDRILTNAASASMLVEIPSTLRD